MIYGIVCKFSVLSHIKYKHGVNMPREPNVKSGILLHFMFADSLNELYIMYILPIII